MTRVLALWQQLAGHTSACFRALQDEGAEVRIVYRSATPDAPFDDLELTAGLDAVSWTDEVDAEFVAAELNRFQPDVVLVCSWNVGAYRTQMRAWKGHTLRVVFMDNPWRSTVKQWAGRLARSQIIAPTFDASFVSGERQAVFARYLGIPADHLLWGVNCCAPEFFTGPRSSLPEQFVFVGRLAPEKGIDVLASAYRRYRAETPSPWPLVVVGDGPERVHLQGLDGVDLRGFVQPAELPAVFQQAGCLVLPSRFEPWGVVIHEALASGVPVVCSDECGASTRLVLDGYSGRVVPADDVDALVVAMSWISSRSAQELAELSRAGAGLADQFHPARWASYFLTRCTELAPAVRS